MSDDLPVLQRLGLATTHHLAASDGMTCRLCGVRIALGPGAYRPGERVALQDPEYPGGSWRSWRRPDCLPAVVRAYRVRGAV